MHRWGVLVWAVLVSCGESPPPLECHPGAAHPCACADGSSGSRICGANGRLAACGCRPPSPPAPPCADAFAGDVAFAGVRGAWDPGWGAVGPDETRSRVLFAAAQLAARRFQTDSAAQAGVEIFAWRRRSSPIRYDELAASPSRFWPKAVYYVGRVVEVIDLAGEAQALRVATRRHGACWTDEIFVMAFIRLPEVVAGTDTMILGNVGGQVRYPAPAGRHVVLPSVIAAVASTNMFNEQPGSYGEGMVDEPEPSRPSRRRGRR